MRNAIARELRKVADQIEAGAWIVDRVATVGRFYEIEMWVDSDGAVVGAKRFKLQWPAPEPEALSIGSLHLMR